MGSDLSMSPPTPDEFRVVRSGDFVALYRRHTDNIYRDGTRTWFREGKVVHDPSGKVEHALRLPGGSGRRRKRTTVAPHTFLENEMPYEAFLEVDRDWDREEGALTEKVRRAYEDADRAAQRARAAQTELDAFKDERAAAAAKGTERLARA